MKSKYTKELLEPIVSSSTSMRQVLLSLDLKYTGGNFGNIKSHINRHGLSTEHFLGQGVNLGKESKNRHRPEDYLTVYPPDMAVKTHRIKEKMFRDGVVDRKCMRCGGTTWLGEPIPLSLHHKNGNRWDNRKENLEILCYNCHGLTDNYSGKSNNNKVE